MASYEGKELTKYEVALLRKMFYHGYIGARHTDEDSVIRGFPKHERGKIKKELEKLVRKNLVIEYPSTGQTHVSLNPFQIAAVKQILESANNC